MDTDGLANAGSDEGPNHFTPPLSGYSLSGLKQLCHLVLLYFARVPVVVSVSTESAVFTL